MSALRPSPARFEFTDENANGLMETASYSGISYWAENPTQEHYDSTPEGKTWCVVDSETGDAHFLSVQDIRAAYFALLDLDQPYVARWLHDYFIESWRDRTREDGVEMGAIDATAADVAVQVACFGRVLYG